VRAAFRCWGERLFRLWSRSNAGAAARIEERFLHCAKEKSSTQRSQRRRDGVARYGFSKSNGQERLRCRRADSEVGPYNNVHRIAVSDVVNIEEGRTKVLALHRQRLNQEAGASSRSQMLR